MVFGGQALIVLGLTWLLLKPAFAAHRLLHRRT
jgi:hypothetical protein